MPLTGYVARRSDGGAAHGCWHGRCGRGNEHDNEQSGADRYDSASCAEVLHRSWFPSTLEASLDNHMPYGWIVVHHAVEHLALRNSVRRRALRWPLSSADGSSRHDHPRGRHRAGGRGCGTAGPGRRPRRHRVGRRGRRCRRPRDPRRAPPGGDARRDPRLPRGHQGPDHDPGRDRVPQRERRAPPGARPLRRRAPRTRPARRARSAIPTTNIVVVRENTEDLYQGIEFERGSPEAAALREEAPGPRRLRGARGRRHHVEADLGRGHPADRAVRVRVRAGERPAQGHAGPQVQRHAVLGRPLPPDVPRPRRAIR